MPLSRTFETLRSEGGLLPADLLQRINDPASRLDGMRPEDYGLPAGERLTEGVTQSWNRLRKHWQDFAAAREHLTAGEAGTGLTNEKWTLPLLRELGFGPLPTEPGRQVNGHTFAINRFVGPVPVHLVGCGVDLDRRASGVRGASSASPHGLLQDFLNREKASQWGLTCNGVRLRVLRDNQALSRQSYFEADLEGMFSGEVFGDFAVLWYVAHHSRFAPREGKGPDSCWLEQWTKVADEQGTRALGKLRIGVQDALLCLGQGFTSHPQNTALRDALRSKTLTPTELHGQLLRVVYRLIFLFVAEDRMLEGQPLLHPPDDSEAAREARARYAAYFSTARVREMAARIRGSRHADLWRQFQTVVVALSGEPKGEAARSALALPALGSFLWSPASTAALNDAQLTNHDLLEALRHLAFTMDGRQRRAVDYRSLGAEELGGVYEGLLALTPEVGSDGATFTFAEFAGNQRKTSGSYYTPDSLVQCLLDSALEPVVTQAIEGKKGQEAERAILALKVCDPAVGSGHFLVGTAHRLAKHLARVRAQAAGESEPSPRLYQQALRDVIGRCLYGVDINSMSAELCRVSLWLEALEPGKPLSFLDHHIRVGNSLLGATPELITAGIPDEAYSAIDGDDRRACSALRTRNRGQRDNKKPLLAALEEELQHRLEQATSALDNLPDTRHDDIREKERQFRDYEQTEEYRLASRIADVWCAAFVCPKRIDAHERPLGLTQIHLDEAAEGKTLPPELAEAVTEAVAKYRFVHWHVVFPGVHAQGGFDCIIGNPPWEKLTPIEQEFFSSIPIIANEQRSDKRKLLIDALKGEHSEQYSAWIAYRHQVSRAQLLIASSSRYPLTAVGELNLFALFAELSHQLSGPRGEVGMIVKSSLLTAPTWAGFTAMLLGRKQLRVAYDFRNWAGWFDGVGYHERFTLLHFGQVPNNAEVSLGFYFDSPEDVRTQKCFSLSQESLLELNPITKTLPVFDGQESQRLLVRLYSQFPLISSRDAGWEADYSAGIHMSSDANLLRSKEELTEAGALPHEFSSMVLGKEVYLPVMEGKLLHQFDHRFATFAGIQEAERFGRKAATNSSTDTAKADAEYSIEPRYWIEAVAARTKSDRRGVNADWTFAFRDTTNVISNFRTAVGTIVCGWVCNYKAPNLVCRGQKSGDAKHLLRLAGLFNSMPFDYVVRQKFFGANLIKSILDQIACPSPAQLARYEQRLGYPLHPASLELIYTSWELEPFALACGWNAPPFRWDEDRRLRIRAEQDALLFHLYFSQDEHGGWSRGSVTAGAQRDESESEYVALVDRFGAPRLAVEYVLDSFSILASKEEERFGEYRTKRLVLEAYDAMQDAMRKGTPYRSRVVPSPGPPLSPDGAYLRYEELDTPPPHIHLARDTAPEAAAEVLLADLARLFPPRRFTLRASVAADSVRHVIEPATGRAVTTGERVVLAHPDLSSHGERVPAALGTLRIDARRDAATDEEYALVSVHGDNGVAQVRLSADEWANLRTIGWVLEN